MKWKLAILLVILSCTWIAAVPGVPKNEQQELITMRIKDRQVDCDGFEGMSRCMMVQKGADVGGDMWEVLREPIEGFRYEEGYVYDLNVRMELVPNPDTDHSRYRYVLVEVLSKTKAG